MNPNADAAHDVITSRYSLRTSLASGLGSGTALMKGHASPGALSESPTRRHQGPYPSLPQGVTRGLIRVSHKASPGGLIRVSHKASPGALSESPTRRQQRALGLGFRCVAPTRRRVGAHKRRHEGGSSSCGGVSLGYLHTPTRGDCSSCALPRDARQLTCTVHGCPD